METDNAPLKFGDIISLFSNSEPGSAVPRDGHLASLGLVDERCAVKHINEPPTCPPDKFSDCLFKICPQLKYTARSQCERSERISSKNKNVVELAYYLKWRKAADLEEEQNEKQALKDQGVILKYGAICQLLHVKSGKFLTVNKQQAAFVVKSAMRVSLCSKGSENCWLYVRPIFKRKALGDEVLNCDKVTLIPYHASQPIHVSDKCLHDYPELFEVNAMAPQPGIGSSNGISWKLYLFMDHFDDKECNLKGGSVIRLFHAEQEKFLTCDPHGEGEEYKKAKDFNKDKLGHSVFLRYSARPNPTEATSSKAMWEAQLVELGHPFRSGSAKWTGSLMRFKHLASREYLTVVPFGLACENTRCVVYSDGPKPIHLEDIQNKDQTEYVLTIGLKKAPYYKEQPKPEDTQEDLKYKDQTLFHIYPTRNEGDNDNIYNKAYIRLYHLATGCWVKSTGIPLCVNNTMVGLSGSLEDKEAFALLFVPTQEVRDLDFATDAAKMIHSMSTRWEELAANELKILIQLLEKLVLFLCRKEGSTEDALKVELIQNEAVTRRQKLIREQNILKEIFRLLKRPYDINQDKRVTMKNLPDKKFEGSLHLFKLCYRLIRHSLDGYRKNQEYVAKEFFWFMQQQLGKGINAEETMAHLVKQNAKVLDNYMGDEQINMFLDLLNKHKHARYLQHLCALCVMKNSDTPISQSVQKLVKRNLLDVPSQNILIKIMYEDEDSDLEDKFQLSVPWNESLDRIGQKKLCEEKTNSKLIRIYEYWKWQLELYSALCYGRHYSAIEHPILKEQLNVQTVFQCMKDTDLPLSLRAVYCKLLQTMYLDVNPQTLISPIEYARLWQDIPQEMDHIINSKLMREVPQPVELLEEDLQDNEHDKRVYECLIETTEYIKTELSRESCLLGSSLEQDQFIFELVHTSEMLVKFGFYSFDKLLNLTDTLLSLIEKNMIDVVSPKEEDSVKENIEQKEMIHTTYLEVLKIIDFVMNLRLDIRLSIILVLFKNKYKQKDLHKGSRICSEDHLDIITEVDKYFQSRSSKLLSLDEESGKKLVKVLLFLITEGKISKEEKLIKRIKVESLNILFRHFNQRKEFIHAFKQIQMLVSEPDREDYLIIKDALENLKKFLDRKSLSLGDETKEGGKVPSRVHSMRRGTVKGDLDYLMHNPELILMKLSDLCHDNTSRIVHVQRLLRNLGSHKSVLNLVEMAIKEKNLSSESLIVEAHRFLQKFCRGNENNQKLLYQDIKLLINTDNPPEESETLRSIFENNEELCVKITEDIIQKFISAIEKESVPNMVYLNLFQTLVKVKKKCLIKNQDLMLTSIMNSDDVLKLCNEERSLQMLEESMYKNDEEMLKGYKYHLNLIKLIALCVEGVNGTTILKCQSMISLEDLARVLCNSGITNAEVKKEYANLLLHAYVEFDQELISKKTIWTILQYFIYDIAMVFKHTEPGCLSGQELHRKTYVMDYIIPIVSAFFSNYSSSQRKVNQQKYTEIFIQLIQHISQLLSCKPLYPDFTNDQWNAVQCCLEILHKLSKDWIVVFPPELDSVVEEAKNNINQLYVVRKMVRTTTGGLRSRRKPTIDKSQDIESTISELTSHLEDEMNPLINVDTFVLIACFIYPWELFPSHIAIADKMKERDHITALMHIATNCAKSNEALCLLTLRTLREYIETPYLGEIECESEEDMAKREKQCHLAREQCMIYFRGKPSMDRRASQSSQEEESTPIQNLFDYHYTVEMDDPVMRRMIVERQCALDDKKISQLVVNLVQNSFKKETTQLSLFFECLKLGIALLNGGNRVVQKSLFTYFHNEKSNEDFFTAIKKCTDRAQIEIKNTTQSGQHDPIFRPKSVVGMSDLTLQSINPGLTELGCMKTVLRYLQLLCENHDMHMQRMLRVQKPNMVKETIQFLEAICGGTTAGLGLVSAYINRDNEALLIQCLETLTEYCQGPCNENQDCLASPDTLAIDIISSLIVSDIDTPRNLDVRSTAITTLLAVMESRDETDITDKILLRMRKENLVNMIRKLRNEAISLRDNPDTNEKKDQLNGTGHSLYILAHQLSQHQRPLAELIKREFDKDREIDGDKGAKRFSHFVENTSSIEIVRQDSDKIRMERIVFPKPEICNHLDEQTQISFLKNAKSDNKGSRVDYFFKQFDELYSIMENKQRLKTSDWRVYITNRAGIWSNLKFSLALIINVILALYFPFEETHVDIWNCILIWACLGAYMVASEYVGSKDKEKTLHYTFCALSFVSLTLVLTIGYFSMKTVLFVLGFIQLVNVSVFFLSYLGNQGGLYWDSSFWKTLRDRNDNEFYYHCVYLIICVLGFLIHPFFCSLLLFDIVHRETTLQNVIRSVTKNWFSIMLTFVLALILIYIFSILGYLFFQDDFWVLYDPRGCSNNGTNQEECDDQDKSEKTCETLFLCILTTLWQGMRQGGGIGDVLRKTSKEDTPHYYLRVLYDMAFFFLIIVITLNLILGVIVDTFANLRSIQSEQEDVLNNSCFICGLKRSDFDKMAVKFEDHIRKEHNVWHYLQFRAYLKAKPHTEYTGPESYVQNQIELESTEWFPWLRAMSLWKSEDENEIEQNEFGEIKFILFELAKKIELISDRCNSIEAKLVDKTGTIRQQQSRRIASGTKIFQNLVSQTMIKLNPRN